MLFRLIRVLATIFAIINLIQHQTFKYQQFQLREWQIRVSPLPLLRNTSGRI